MSNKDLFGEPIYSYTRKQAIEDGVLIDLSHIETIKRHWKSPFACTSTVWAFLNQPTEIPGMDLSKVCNDLSVLARLQIQFTNDESDRVLFHFNMGRDMRILKLHVGPGDTSDDVLTLMFENED